MGVATDKSLQGLTTAVNNISTSGMSDSTGQAINSTLGTLMTNTTGQAINTTLQSLVGAISPAASNVTFDNTGTDLTSSKVQGAIEELDGLIGNIINSDFTLKPTTANSWTSLTSINLPKGKYIVNSVLWLDDSFTSVYNHRLNQGTSSIAVIRNNGVSGGGSCLSKIVTTNNTVTITLLVYTPIATKASGLLEAVSIK